MLGRSSQHSHRRYRPSIRKGNGTTRAASMADSPGRTRQKRSCFPLSIRRRMRARHRYNDSPSSSPTYSPSRPLSHSPIRKDAHRGGRQSPTVKSAVKSGVKHDEWTENSEGLKIAKRLVGEGLISVEELHELVQADKRFYTHNPGSLVGPGGSECNNECPISLQPLKRGPGETTTIQHPDVEEAFVRYDTKSLAEYLIESGSEVDPVQRRKYSDEELHMIDKNLVTMGVVLRKRIFDAVRHDTDNEKKERSFQTTALSGLDNLIGECIGEIFELLEKDRENAQQHYAQFLMNILPNFDYLFMQMMSSDATFAQQCLEQYISRLQGPPNRPTEDTAGILPRVLESFKSKMVKSNKPRVRTHSADSIMDIGRERQPISHEV
eukprot:Stramenopile-MAST_4_protein_2200